MSIANFQSNKVLFQMLELKDTILELNGLCVGYKECNLELYTYYRSMLEWTYSMYDYLRVEAQTLKDLEWEQWDKKYLKPTEPQAEYTIEVFETIEPFGVQEKEYKPPFEKIIEFTLFGYSFFFVLEISKK
jgi:hypothetical protein